MTIFDCCEINDYDSGEPDEQDFVDPYGPCANCGHSPEEHGR